MIRIRSPQDLVGGLFLILIAVLALVFSGNLPVGRAVSMGPGYVPRLLAWVLMGIGALLAARSLVINGPRLEAWALRPLVVLTIAILVFALLLERAGLVIAIFVAVAIARAAAPEYKPLPVLGLGAVLATGSVALFVYALGLPLRPWPEFGG